MIVFPAKVAAARAAAGLSRRAGAGGGTSLPGKLLLRMAPDAIPRLSRRIAGGAVVVSATNGKTTTAKMLAAMLEPERRLCRNAAGANLASGVASSLLACREADLGVFEVDEAALEDVAPALAPRVLGLGNLFRDQLDRYGELEAVAARWRRISAAGAVAARPKRRRPARGRAAGRGRIAYVRDRRSERRAAGPPPRRRLEMVRCVRRAAELRRGVPRPPRSLVVPRVRKRPAAARGVCDEHRVRRPRRHALHAPHPRRRAAGGHAAPGPLQRLQRARRRGDGMRARRRRARADGGRPRGVRPGVRAVRARVDRRARGRPRPVQEPGRRERGHPHARARPGSQAARRCAQRPDRRRAGRLVDLGRRLRASGRRRRVGRRPQGRERPRWRCG